MTVIVAGWHGANSDKRAIFIYFTDWYGDEYILHTVILLGGSMVVWSWT